MIYLALLRGINVGGNSIVPMKRLRTCVEGIGYDDVRTYINSGNVLFETSRTSAAKLESIIERALEEEFGQSIRVFVRTRDDLQRVVDAIPQRWFNDNSLRSNVLFLSRKAKASNFLERMRPKPDIDHAIATTGAVLWATRRDALTRSAVAKLSKDPLYKEITVRGINTTRKLLDLMRAPVSAKR